MAILRSSKITHQFVGCPCSGQFRLPDGATFLQGVQLEGSQRRVPTLLAGANCTGGETTLTECPGSGLGGPTQQCGLRNIVSLICFSDRDPGKATVACCMDTS